MSAAGCLVARGTHRPHHDCRAGGGRGSRQDSKKAAEAHSGVEAISPALRACGNTLCSHENANSHGFTALARKGRNARRIERGSETHAGPDRENQKPRPECLQVAPNTLRITECIRMVFLLGVPPDPARKTDARNRSEPTETHIRFAKIGQILP